MKDAATALRCRELVKRYDRGVVAVDGLDLDIAAGECFGLLGPNGAGKTTTVEIFEGLLDATSGDVTLLGMRWATHERALRERLGVSLQETHLPDRLSVIEVLTLFRSFFSSGRAPDEVLRDVALEEKKGTWSDKLSGGQKQRLAVACALVGDPELLFLDEPTTGLDPQSRLQLWDVISEFKRSGRTVLLTTHYMDEAERLCDRVGVIDHGKLIALGSPRELIASLGGQEVIELSLEQGTLDVDAVSRLPGVHGVRPIPGARPCCPPIRCTSHCRRSSITCAPRGTRWGVSPPATPPSKTSSCRSPDEACVTDGCRRAAQRALRAHPHAVPALLPGAERDVLDVRLPGGPVLRPRHRLPQQAARGPPRRDRVVSHRRANPLRDRGLRRHGGRRPHRGRRRGAPRSARRQGGPRRHRRRPAYLPVRRDAPCGPARAGSSTTSCSAPRGASIRPPRPTTA